MTHTLTLILTLIYTVAAAQDLRQLHFKGPVKTIIENHYTVNEHFGKNKLTPAGKTTYKFNKRGNITSLVSIDDRSEPQLTVNNTYDSLHHLVATDTITQSIWESSRSFIHYDSAGAIDKRFVYELNGDVRYKYFYTCNTIRKPVEIIIYNARGDIHGKFTFKYEYHPSGQIFAIYETYDERREYFSGDNTEKFCYDTAGNYIGGMGILLTSGSEEIQYLYDPYNHLLKDPEHTYKYLLDKYHNPTDQIIYETRFGTQTPTFATKYIITYY